ncbi:MAG TPA: hypothetical protein DEG17_06780 [Cyanobacteria bacterium UBA11149]|nr:hypothetical protein [Cyanobacteria bacterium UBA11367]HBE58209.1 hypothetical protein [Cyanobacteria bacterium UBA11366]HBK66932.1 hypothetical protein [Cyanobacteria bacterium UBA11166]HBR76159.1 hypothetical protein [Cyanobacteria bacterium UBA11159]HBS70734.1 hypothetical protein [Cyanobacteria bacterium UBA11153]HBW88574.1 hypothetical protein [Cyanobacteria bacterium UBA11149]HCA95865.1 hypothetical protein [Cyanobacteria bacterium UBA9226]
MYTTEAISIQAKSHNVDSLWQAAETLSLAEKAELIEKLLGRESGLMVISASTDLADYVIAQTQLLSWKGLTYVWDAIAAEITAKLN